MCICLTPLLPTETQLLTICVHKNDSYNQYITYYTNSLAQQQKTGKKEVMVVPFSYTAAYPSPLLAVLPTLTAEKELWTALDQVLPSHAPKYEARNQSLGMSNAYHKPVVQCGGYKISIALNFHELSQQINWTEFNLPPNFRVLMEDLQRRFGEQYAFIVAEPHLNRQDQRLGGMFGWMWYGTQAFLPTAHELSSSTKTHYDFAGIILNEQMQELQWEHSKIGIPFHNVYTQKDPLHQDYAQVLTILNSSQVFAPETPSQRYSVPLISHIWNAVRIDLNGWADYNENIVATPPIPQDWLTHLVTSNDDPLPEQRDVVEKNPNGCILS